ncbi:hypothetical protein [Streptomyces sp. NPDC090026]|uniref:hypothetical protein n=1 Tax=Streptomyces sp. NPDC090026 TaxID=3365923 RepID=UPI0038029BB2
MNGRKAKQQKRALRTRNERLLARLRAAEAVYVAPVGEAFEAWQKGPALLFVPTLNEDYPPELKEAVALRRQAAFTGACPCGLTTRISQAGEYDLAHKVTCPADTLRFDPMAAAAGAALDYRECVDVFRRWKAGALSG